MDMHAGPDGTSDLGPSDFGAADVGVGSWIERRARTAPDAVAIVAAGRSFTYAELAGRIRRLANGLRELGVGPGDRVAWMGTNHLAFLEAFFAAGLLGAALAPVNHRLHPDEARSILAEAQPSVVAEHLPADPGPPPAPIRHRIAVGEPRPDALGYEDLVAGSPDRPVDAAVRMDDVALLPHTSGTTGRPKRIMLTHANLTWNVVNFLSSADFRGGDVTLAIAPFFRVGGLGVNVLPVLFLGGTVVIPDEGTADEILELTERHRATVGFGNPDSLDALVRSARWADADLSSLRFVLTGGAPVPEGLIRVFLDRGVRLVQGYGLSEAGPLALVLDPQTALRKVGSAGRPPLFVDVRIVGTNGEDLGPGPTGELLVRGPNVMAGYWNRPDATREVLSADGWLRTGDAARSDEDGDVWIVDRVAAGIVTDAGLVYPGDVERVLQLHPAVADAGVTSSGDRLVALVVPAAGAEVAEDELLAFARERLEPHAAPTAVRFVERLPRSSVGKLVRAELRDLASGSFA